MDSFIPAPSTFNIDHVRRCRHDSIEALSYQQVIKEYKRIIKTSDNRKDLVFFIKGYFNLRNKRPLPVKYLRKKVAKEVRTLRKEGDTFDEIADQVLVSPAGLRKIMKGEITAWDTMLAVLIRIDDKYLRLLD